MMVERGAHTAARAAGPGRVTRVLGAGGRLLALTVTLGAVVGLAAPAAAASTAAERRTVFAMPYWDDEAGPMWRLTLDATGKVLARTPVHQGLGGIPGDYAGGRLAFTRPGDGIWIREASGTSRRLGVPGEKPIFTPGRTALLFSRLVSAPDDTVAGGVERHSELWLYSFRTGSTRRLFTLPKSHTVMTYRFSDDGELIWFKDYDDNHDASDNTALKAYRLDDRKVVRAIPLPCLWFELLPGGTHVISSCNEHVRVIRLATGSVVRSARLPSGTFINGAHGTLSGTERFIAGNTDGDFWLGGIDAQTLRLRRIAGTTGLFEGVAAR